MCKRRREGCSLTLTPQVPSKNSPIRLTLLPLGLCQQFQQSYHLIMMNNIEGQRIWWYWPPRAITEKVADFLAESEEKTCHKISYLCYKEDLIL